MPFGKEYVLFELHVSYFLSTVSGYAYSCYLLIYLLTYLLTYLFQGAESFLRS